MPLPPPNPIDARALPPAPAPATAPPKATPLIPRRAAMALVTTVTVLLLLLRFDPGMSPDGQVTSSSTRAAEASQESPAATLDDATSGEAASTVISGDAVATRFGTVQVQVTVSGDTLVDVTALQLPSGGRDSQISGYAEPILRSEALEAGSASIDTVSGATYTSMGYIQSLQSALDAAGIG